MLIRSKIRPFTTFKYNCEYSITHTAFLWYIILFAGNMFLKGIFY